MADKNKVIRGWERCKKCSMSPISTPEELKAYLDCEYTVGLYCGKDKLINQTIELLKEPGTIKPKETGFSFPATIIFNYECECGTPVMREQSYCMKCGKEMIWSD